MKRVIAKQNSIAFPILHNFRPVTENEQLLEFKEKNAKRPLRNAEVSDGRASASKRANRP